MTTTERPLRPSLAIAAVTAPVLWFAAELVSPALASSTARQLDVIARDPNRWYAYTVLLLAGTVVFVPALAGLSLVARDGSRRLTAVATTLLGYGTLIAIGDVMSQLLVWKAASPAVERAQALAMLDSVDKAAGAGILFATGGLSWLVGSVVMSVALVRSGRVPAWCGVAFGLAMVLQLFGFGASSVAAIAVSDVLAVVALLPVARSLAGSRAEVPLTRTGTVLAT